ncbi:unnamed protein product (macronuclear) [Paramecium tetraurelia]|uniref:EF-hand domain-containing protein n=1 Tax=Paramecium tetraurelia TaxID=5888 RepID=A0E9E3_PARTE|nr:uncharacterized protein GSPATT00024641001 [Paramecium tetraurelia]CAK91910.1 unnamed protein product [Paramecium tetraurelia]|eukprot:XP_001459307.1 hypothetical protein (macronuclear) [Paramecium tetraurelia strain d4-2]
MTNFIEESMIINHLTSPQNFNHPNQQPSNLKPYYKHSSIPQNSQNSLLNLLDMENPKIVEDKNSDNIVNPMSSQSNLSSDNQRQMESDLELKQVLTEINDPDCSYQCNLKESQICKESEIKQSQHQVSISELQQQQIEKHKQIILRKNQHLKLANSFNTYVNQNQFQSSSPTNQIQLNEIRQEYQILDRDQLKNFKEIYNFYCKQPITTNKYQTFEKLQQLSNTMILQKFMIFCKDFKLIDLEISSDLISFLGGKNNNLRKKQINYNYKNNNRSNFILTKFYLVQMFKQNADKNMELNLDNFIILIQKLADLLFPQQNYLLYEFLDLKNPKVYRKKMTLVGKPFHTKEQSEIITQEKLYERKNIILPHQFKLKSESTKKQEDNSPLQFPKISRRTNTYKCYSPCSYEKHKIDEGNSLQLEELYDYKQDVEQKRVLFEHQFNEKEDDFNLQEFQYSNRRSNAKKNRGDQFYLSKINKAQQFSLYSNILGSIHKCDRLSSNSRNQIEISQNMVASGVTRPSNMKSFENQENSAKKSPSYSPQTRELCNLEKKYLIHQAFANQQSCRNNQAKKTKF